jgi:fructose-1,6-bisphosphatase/inositol monophosphatase family enzyme
MTLDSGAVADLMVEVARLMVALVEDGESVAAWIHQPVSGTTYRAERGGGAYRDDQRLVIPGGARPRAELRGIALTRFLPGELRAAVDRGASEMPCVTGGPAAAGIEYPRLATGVHDFVLFWRTLPWDHAPGALLVTEAGGVAMHLDGRDYQPGRPRDGLLVADGQQTWHDVRQALGLPA